MSATGRSDVRRPDDAYETPVWCVKRLLEEIALPGGRWLEPCAGSGAILSAVELDDVRFTAVELREEGIKHLQRICCDGDIVLHGDFLGGEIQDALARERAGWGGGRYSVCITNPPYSLAEEFVRACIPLARYTIMLLRLNWLASERRSTFMRSHMPDVYVLPNRPSFTGGGTDCTEYAWFVWPPDRDRNAGIIKVLASSPKEERKNPSELTLSPVSA